MVSTTVKDDNGVDHDTTMMMMKMMMREIFSSEKIYFVCHSPKIHIVHAVYLLCVVFFCVHSTFVLRW